MDIKLYQHVKTKKIICVTSCAKTSDYVSFRCTPEVNIPNTQSYVPGKSNCLYYIIAHSGKELTQGQRDLMTHLRRFFVKYDERGIPCNQLSSTITLTQVQKIEAELNQYSNTFENSESCSAD